MEIKQFKVISTTQKNELFNFIKSTDLTYNKSYIEMIKYMKVIPLIMGTQFLSYFMMGKLKEVWL